MNRLLLTIMFAIALALSFMSLARNDMSWNSNSQNSSASDSENGGWVSRMAHLFGSYKPVMGRVTLASDDLTPCNGAPACDAVTDKETNKVLGYRRVSDDKNDKTKKTVNFDFKCDQCDTTSHYQVSVSKTQKTDLTDLSDEVL